jgi:hypothetical protein
LALDCKRGAFRRGGQNDRLMDYELMGGDARQAIIDQDARRNIPVTLPPQVPFGSHQWPTLITPGPGAKSLADLP